MAKVIDRPEFGIAIVILPVADLKMLKFEAVWLAALVDVVAAIVVKNCNLTFHVWMDGAIIDIVPGAKMEIRHI